MRDRAKQGRIVPPLTYRGLVAEEIGRGSKSLSERGGERREEWIASKVE